MSHGSEIKEVQIGVIVIQMTGRSGGKRIRNLDFVMTSAIAMVVEAEVVVAGAAVVIGATVMNGSLEMGTASSVVILMKLIMSQ